MARARLDRRRLRRTAARAREAVRRLRFLLDTHVALWWGLDPSALADRARDAIADGGNEVFLSSASVWETAIKVAAGRLEIPGPIESMAREASMIELPVRWSHASRAAALPPLHRDPFDRMLVAQAIEEALVLVTRDALVRQYPVSTMPG